MNDNDHATFLRLRWPGVGPAAGSQLIVRHDRPLTGSELRMLAEIVDAIENFRDETADPEGLGI
jgi:hypothetical protein